MPEPVIFNENASFGVTASAVVSTEVKTMGRPAAAIDKETFGKEILNWGEDNDFPQKVIQDVRKNPELGTLLDKYANLLYSSGFEYGVIERDEKGNEVLKPCETKLDEEIRLWCKRTALNRYFLEAYKDLVWFGNVFPEIIKSNDQSKIAQICVQAAENCRYAPQNSKGLLDKCFVSANWPDAKITDSNTKKLPVIDPYYNPAETLRVTSGLNFIYPLSYPNPGNMFYQLVNWNAIRESGWLDVSQLVPKQKKALLENQSTIKYHIKISDQYWVKKYDGWDELSPAEKTAKKVAEIAAIQNLIKGAEKSGANFWSTIYSDLSQVKNLDLIQIEPIDDKLKTGQYLEEGKDASSYTMSAVGLHPALVGTMPNNGLGGAGSNIREAYNLFIMSNVASQDLVFEPLNNLIVEYNGWENVVFRAKNKFMTTLDTGVETSSAPQTQTSNTKK